MTHAHTPRARRAPLAISSLAISSLAIAPLAFSSLAIVPSMVRADVRPLARGWVLHERALPSGLEDVGCGDDVAYARDWFGSAARWNGASWSPLPRFTGDSYGRTLAVSPRGTLYLGGGDHVTRWDGSGWRVLPLSDWSGDVDDQLLAWGEDSLYVVGRGRIARLEGASLRTYDGGTWRELHGVSADGAELLVAGQGGTVMRQRAGVWSREATGIGTTIRRLLVTGPGDVWAWADGESWQSSILLHHEGGAWVRRDLAVSERVTSLGGRAGLALVTTETAVLRWDPASHAWTPELTAADLGPGTRLEAVCATRQHLVVGEASGNVIVRPLAP
ncbi:MAG: hypothetical protein U0353_02740 [Sandaracinus sp.]